MTAPDNDPNASRGMTRRQALAAAAASGAAIAATAWGASTVGSLTTRAEFEVEIAKRELELTKLRALLALYEQLERVGLDTLLATGMNIVRGALDTVTAGVRLLRDGIAAVETAIKNFQATLETLRGAANSAAQVLSDLQQKFKAAESVVVAVLGVALPLAESIRGFFNALIEKIPLGIGDNIRRAINALVDLIRAIPAAIESITTQLLKPLGDLFFPATGDAAMKKDLFDPLTQNLLTPLKKLLSDTENLVERWEKDFTAPVQAALAERQKIRKQIAEYRKQNNV